MFSSNRIRLLLATALAAASMLLIVAAYGMRGTATSTKVLSAKLIRRHDKLKDKLSAEELKLLRGQVPQKEERVLEDKLPKYLPIKVKIRPEKDKAFKDLHNDFWERDLEIEVTNTGNRPIYYLVLLIDMPELKHGESNIIFSLRFGDKKFMNFATGAKPGDLSLKRGEGYILKIRNPLPWKEFSRDMPHWPKPKQFVLKFQELSFGDGTGFRSSYDGPWPPPKQSAQGACLQGPWSYAGISKTGIASLIDHDYRRASKFGSGGEPASFLPAKFSYGPSLLFLGSLESNIEPDNCCPSGCSWIREFESDTACYDTGTECDSIHQAEYLYCNDSRGHCSKYQVRYQRCVVDEGDYRYTHLCPYADTSPCASDPTPTPTPSPTPSPSPTPTPCAAGSFDPDQNGNCPSYANKVNGCCICQQTTDCSSFGQGTWPDGSSYCIWVEHLCDCYNIDGPCRDNPRPSETPTPTPDGGYGGPIYDRDCIDYYYVYFYSYDGGNTWHYSHSEYAGCWDYM